MLRKTPARVVFARVRNARTVEIVIHQCVMTFVGDCGFVILAGRVLGRVDARYCPLNEALNIVVTHASKGVLTLPPWESTLWHPLEGPNSFRLVSEPEPGQAVQPPYNN